MRRRDDELSVHCDQASELDVPENIALKPPLQIEGQSNNILNQAATQSVQINPEESSNNSSLTSSEANINHFEPNQIDHDHSKMILIHLTETDKPEEDQFLLKTILQTLLEYPGNDKVDLLISKNSTQWRLEMPIIRTSYCDELSQRLIELIGDNKAIRIETEANTSAA